MILKLVNGNTLHADIKGAAVESIADSHSNVRIHTKSGHTFDVQATAEQMLTWIAEAEEVHPKKR